jgi:hypothetical protein
MRITDLGMGALTSLVAILASSFAAHSFWIVLRDVMLNLHLTWGAIEVQILSVCSIIAAAVTLVLFRRAARGRSLEGLALGALAWWLVLTLVTARWLPNSSYVFAWPTLFALIGLDCAILTRPGSASGRVLILIAAIPNLVLLPPVIRNMIDGLGLRLAGPVTITVTLFLVAILPLLAPVLVDSRRGVAGESSNEGSSPVLAHAGVRAGSR